MRTPEQFKKIWADMQWFVKFHNKCVWIVPTEKDYALSVVPPTADELPNGTAANLYDVECNIVDRVISARQALKEKP